MAAEVQYSVRVPYPSSIVRERDNTLRVEFWRDGAAVDIDLEGPFQLLNGSGEVVYSATPAIVSLGLEITIPAASLSDAVSLGELYQERWSAALAPHPTRQRVFLRPAVLTRFRLAPPIADPDLTLGNYPDLLDQLAGFNTHLQPYIDEAWGWVLRRLFKVGRWPDLLRSTQDLVEVTRERAWFLIFRFMYRRTNGTDGRFERLMDDHKRAAELEWGAVSGRWDSDNDGLPDSLDREVAGGVVHLNAAPRRRLRRRSRW